MGDAKAWQRPREDGSDTFAPGATGQAVNWPRHVDTGKARLLSSAVRRLELDGIRWELQPDAEALLQKLVRDAGGVIKESPAKRITIHHLDGRSYYVKRYRNSAFALRPFKFFFKRSQAWHEWTLAQQLEARQIPIVRHVAFGERWSWRGLEESILVTEGFDGRMLHEAVGIDPAAVLAFVKRMHERGILQVDLHPGNILVKLDPLEIRLVDLHGTQVQIGRAHV